MAHVDKPLIIPCNVVLSSASNTGAGLSRASGQTTPHSDRSEEDPFDTDVEALAINSSTDKCHSTSIALHRISDCQVWPGKDDWKKRAKAAKKNRGCTCLSRLDRRTRIAVKIMIVVLVVGLAVAIGFGVSKPLGAPIWGDNGT